jgi:hypothetical protein
MDSKSRWVDAVLPGKNTQLNGYHSVGKTGAILVGPISCSIREISNLRPERMYFDLIHCRGHVCYFEYVLKLRDIEI